MKQPQEKKKAASGRRNRKVAILYGGVPPDASKDELDVLDEVKGVSEALEQLGYKPVPVPLTLDVRKAVAAMRKQKPLFVFNLVESIEGSGRLIHVAPSLLDKLGLRYTGAPTEGMFLTSNKVLAKRLMASAGVPTLPWCSESELRTGRIPFEPPYILKSVWEHASIGVHEASVIHDRSAVPAALAQRTDGTGHSLYLEPYLDGREFNIAILGGGNGPQVLPPSEIQFADYPEGKLKIVDYRAKWDEGSFEYEHTPRSFDFPEEDKPLIREMVDMSMRSWDLFGLRGYARVDLRVGPDRRPWIMEVNANPCISPDGGFLSHATEADMDYNGFIERIVQDALRG